MNLLKITGRIMGIRIANNQDGVQKGKIRYQFDTHILGIRYRKTIVCTMSAVNSLYRHWEKKLIIDLEGNFKFFEKLDEYLIYSQSMKTEKTFYHEQTIINDVVKKFFKKDFLLNDFRHSHVDDLIIWRKNYFVTTPYHQHRNRKQLSNGTINRTLTVMSSFFKWAIKKKYYHRINPFHESKLPENNQREVKLSNSQVNQLLKTALTIDIRLYNVIMIALLTGMRRSEIFSLEWNEVDLENSQIILSRLKTKSQKSHICPIIVTLKKLLVTIKKEYPDSNFVVHNFTMNMLYKKWCKLIKQLPFGILPDGTKLRFHDIRHIYAQFLLNLGVDLTDIQFLLGHQSIQTTQNRYAMFARPDLLEKVSKLDTILNDSTNKAS